tara:strand:+ start:12968 stop:16168 length:3201 start_codon:yes stop_codon:yes gene_type:complete
MVNPDREWSVADVPEVGQLVEVRRRQYVVSEVVRSTLEPDPLHAARRPQHLAKLTSIEEDALGEELQVIWELEPGARVHDGGDSLPKIDGFDDPVRFDAFVDAIRWGAVSSADDKVLQSPFRSGISIEDYQLEPVARALQMPRANLLIADDVGLGKTIEAGLVAQELLLRHRARSILIVCPASLQIHWVEQMRDKFGLTFKIVDSTFMKELRRRRGLHVNPWTQFPRLITSIDYLKREQPMRMFREVLPRAGEPVYPRRFDLLIVDEAHNVAPSGPSGQYTTDSERTRAIRTLAPHFEHKLFLSATPHNGHLPSFMALLELLDDQRFTRVGEPDPVHLDSAMIRRLKRDIKTADGKDRFPKRLVESIFVDYKDEERQIYEDLQRYRVLREEAVSEGSSRTATTFVLKLLKKRFFSSPAAFLTTLEQHERTLRGIGGAAKRNAKIKVSVLEQELSPVDDEEWADDEEFETELNDAVGLASRYFEELGDEERKLLRGMQDWAQRNIAVPDSKAKTLLDWLEETLRPGGKWNDERVIIFTEYRATQKWLQGLFATRGLAKKGRLATIHGGMDRDEREEVKASFQSDAKNSDIRILLATDAASEGIDLQNHCHRVIHYEIPWNPNRLEQRNGRVDRHGQTADEVLTYHFVGGSSDGSSGLEGDLEFLMAAAKKVERIDADLKGKVNPVIASQIKERMAGKRSLLDVSAAESSGAPMRKVMQSRRKIRDEVARLHEQLEASRRELRVSPENVKTVVSIGLELAGQPALIESKLKGVWPSSDGSHVSCPVFDLPQLRGSWQDCLDGIVHPHTGETRPVTFDHAVAAGRDDVVLVHLNHRLVRMCQRLLRAEVWSSRETKQLHRVTARLVPDSVTSAPTVLAFGRIVVLGGDNKSLHEEIIVSSGTIADGRFRRLNVGQTSELLDSVSSVMPSQGVLKELESSWGSIESKVFDGLKARVKERTKNLGIALSARQEREESAVRDVLEGLAKTIEDQLGEHVDSDGPVQLELIPDARRELVRDQLDRNQRDLRRRLEEIPAEIEREQKRIREHYENPVPRLFPVAVMFLVPESQA